MFGFFKRKGKTFRIAAGDIRPLIEGLGYRIATDRIVVDGRKVGRMYRDEPGEVGDSGWCFFAGDESEAYLAKTENSGVYDVNTIANYDPEIVPLLDSAAPVAFEREGGGGRSCGWRRRSHTEQVNNQEGS